MIQENTKIAEHGLLDHLRNLTLFNQGEWKFLSFHDRLVTFHIAGIRCNACMERKRGNM
jgi:hypothetical protein